MIHQKIKDLFSSSVELICSDISKYSVNPDTNLHLRAAMRAAAEHILIVNLGGKLHCIVQLFFHIKHIISPPLIWFCTIPDVVCGLHNSEMRQAVPHRPSAKSPAYRSVPLTDTV